MYECNKTINGTNNLDRIITYLIEKEKRVRFQNELTSDIKKKSRSRVLFLIIRNEFVLNYEKV